MVEDGSEQPDDVNSCPVDVALGSTAQAAADEGASVQICEEGCHACVYLCGQRWRE